MHYAKDKNLARLKELAVYTGNCIQHRTPLLKLLASQFIAISYYEERITKDRLSITDQV